MKTLILLFLFSLSVFGAADGINGEVLTKVGTTGTVQLPGSQTTNVTISIISKVTDSASAVAFSLDSSNVLSTSGANLLNISNNGVLKNSVSANGGINVGDTTTYHADDGVALIAFRTTGNGDADYGGLYVETRDHAGANRINSDFDLEVSTDNASIGLHSQDTHGGGNFAYWQVSTGTNNVDLFLNVTTGTVTDLWPTAPDGSASYTFDTSLAHTSGNLAEFKNHGSLAFSIGATKNIILAGTTNQIVFGSTNTAPSSSVAPTKWISVQVTGESAVYRIPLYQ